MWSSLWTTKLSCCRSEICQECRPDFGHEKVQNVPVRDWSSFMSAVRAGFRSLPALPDGTNVYDTVPSGWHMQNGTQKWYGSCGRSSAQVNFSWRTGANSLTGWFEICPQSLRGAWTASSWCFSHASDNYRQHQRTCHHDWRENGRPVTQGMGSVGQLGSIKLFSQRQNLQLPSLRLPLVLQWGSSWLG